MASFKKSVSIDGTFKCVAVENGSFFDVETGELIDVASIIESAIGSSQPFDLKVNKKDAQDISTDE